VHTYNMENLDIDKLVNLKNEIIDDGFKKYFSKSSDNNDELLDVLLDSIEDNWSPKTKKIIKIIIQSNDEYKHRKIMESIQESITNPLLKVVERLDQLTKEFYGNGKSK